MTRVYVYNADGHTLCYRGFAHKDPLGQCSQGIGWDPLGDKPFRRVAQDHQKTQRLQYLTVGLEI